MNASHRKVKKQRTTIQNIKYYLFESENFIINWPDYYKGVLLCCFALLMIIGHSAWYLFNFYTENNIWLNSDYLPHRSITTIIQIVLVFLFLLFIYVSRNHQPSRTAIGFVSPIFFGLLMIFSAYNVGLYSPAVMCGIVSLVLIGFVLYSRSVIYTVSIIVMVVIGWLSYLTETSQLGYAPLFSDQLNQSVFYKNPFWIQSMAILYLPMLFISAFFFEIMLSQWRRRENKIKRLSQRDPLTNVYNRRYINKHMQSLINQNIPYAFIILDLDYFKKMNDSYGHEVGDLILKRVARILMAETRCEDVVGRLGGEEFVILLSQCDLKLAIDIAERCRSKIEQDEIPISENKTTRITASFGVAISRFHRSHFNHDGTMDIYSIADQALYLAKQSGRNQVRHIYVTD